MAISASVLSMEESYNNNCDIITLWEWYNEYQWIWGYQGILYQLW